MARRTTAPPKKAKGRVWESRPVLARTAALDNAPVRFSITAAGRRRPRARAQRLRTRQAPGYDLPQILQARPAPATDRVGAGLPRRAQHFRRMAIQTAIVAEGVPGPLGVIDIFRCRPVQPGEAIECAPRSTPIFILPPRDDVPLVRRSTRPSRNHQLRSVAIRTAARCGLRRKTLPEAERIRSGSARGKQPAAAGLEIRQVPKWMAWSQILHRRQSRRLLCSVPIATWGDDIGQREGG